MTFLHLSDILSKMNMGYWYSFIFNHLRKFLVMEIIDNDMYQAQFMLFIGIYIPWYCKDALKAS